jgi:hypothetical protein
MRFLEGKKTMVGGALILLAAVAAVFLEQVTPVAGLALAAFGFSIVGMADKANRHQEELLLVLRDIARAGSDALANNTPALARDALDALRDGVVAGTQMTANATPAGPAQPDGFPRTV